MNVYTKICDILNEIYEYTLYCKSNQILRARNISLGLVGVVQYCC